MKLFLTPDNVMHLVLGQINLFYLSINNVYIINRMTFSEIMDLNRFTDGGSAGQDTSTDTVSADQASGSDQTEEGASCV